MGPCAFYYYDSVIRTFLSIEAVCSIARKVIESQISISAL